jgi:hypothetical protein
VRLAIWLLCLLAVTGRSERKAGLNHIGDNKYRVRGRGVGDRLIQVIYAIEPGSSVYIIYARPLTDREKHQLRGRKP